MSVIYNNTVKNSRLTVVLNAIDQGASFGTLELQAANDDVLAIFTLPDPSGAVASQALTLDCTPPLSTVGTAAAGAGTDATKARVKDSDGTVIISGLTAGEAATDIILDNSNIAEDQVVQLNSGVITHG